MLRHQAAGTTDHAQSSPQSGQQQLCHLKDRGRAVRPTERRRLGHFPPCKHSWPAQRQRAIAVYFFDRLAQAKRCFVTEARRDFVFVRDLARTILMAASGTRTGTYHFSTGRDVAVRELYDAVVRAMQLNHYPEPDIRPLGADDAPSISWTRAAPSVISARLSSHRSTRSLPRPSLITGSTASKADTPICGPSRTREAPDYRRGRLPRLQSHRRISSARRRDTCHRQFRHR